MSLVSKRTGLTAAEQKERLTEQELLKEALTSETENAELLMLRALNKQLMSKLTENKTLQDKMYQLIESLKETSIQQKQETANTLSTLSETVTQNLKESTTEHYSQLITSCRIIDKTAERLTEENNLLTSSLTNAEERIKTELDKTRKTVKRYALVGITISVIFFTLALLFIIY